MHKSIQNKIRYCHSTTYDQVTDIINLHPLLIFSGCSIETRKDHLQKQEKIPY